MARGCGWAESRVALGDCGAGRAFGRALAAGAGELKPILRGYWFGQGDTSLNGVFGRLADRLRREFMFMARDREGKRRVGFAGLKETC